MPGSGRGAGWQQVLDRAGEIVGNRWLIVLLSGTAAGLWWWAKQVTVEIGHLPLQLAGDREGAIEVLTRLRDSVGESVSAGAEALDGIRANIFVDFGFIPVYVALLAGLLLFARRHWYLVSRLHRIIDVTVLLVVGAGVFDYVETGLILSYLPDTLEPSALAGIGSTAPLLASSFAVVKYTALAAAAVLVVPALVGGGWRAVAKWAHFERSRWIPGLSMQTLDRPPSWSESIPDADAGDRGRVGVCFSGGGIRAGSFALGGIQALHREGVLPGDVDVMTSVSGGGYLAGAYEMARSRGAFAAGGETPHSLASGSPEERFIRNHSAYLTYEPGQKLALAGHLLRGIALNALAVFLVLYVLLRPVGWGLWEINDGLIDPSSGSVLFSIPTAHLLAVGWALALAGLAYFMTMMPTVVGEGDGHDAFVFAGKAFTGWAALIAFVVLVVPFALWVTFVAMPWLLGWLVESVPIAEGEPDTKARILTLIGAGGALAFIAEGARRQLQKVSFSAWAIIAAAVVVPALLLFLVASVIRGGYVDGTGSGAAPFGQPISERWYWLILTGSLFVWGLMSDQRSWSMHRFYKRRLADAFSVRRVRPSGAPAYAEQIPYREPTYFRTPAGEPPLVVACVANVNDYAVEPPGLRATSFTFSAVEIGGPQVGYLPTEALKVRFEERVRRRDITVPAAVAISGAAASPAMGKMSLPMLRMLIALANVRLGVWFPNPRWVRHNGLGVEPSEGETEPRQWFDRPRLPYLFKEMLGIHSIDDKFLYLTDGGHLDNLGLVELLRRGCRLVYAFDAAGGKPGTFATIGEAMAIARAELGVAFDLDLNQLRPADAAPPPGTPGTATWSSAAKGGGWPWSRRRPVRGGTLVEQSYAIGTFRYPDGRTGDIVYVQAAATASMPWAVRWYWEKNPAFPNHSTAGQDFDFREFEAYRALGFWAGTVAHREFSGGAEMAFEEVKSGL